MQLVYIVCMVLFSGVLVIAVCEVYFYLKSTIEAPGIKFLELCTSLWCSIIKRFNVV